MDLLWAGLREAVRLLASGEPTVWQIVSLSLRVSLTATGLAAALGVPLGVALALGRFRGRTLAIALVNTGMGLPPVVVGLVVTLFLWPSVNDRLQPKLKKELKPGTRVVSYWHDMTGWQPDRVISGGLIGGKIYLWTIPERAP